MGHWCRVWDRVRRNERFSGKGHRHHICKECQKLPKSERAAILREQELWGYLNQSNISKRNRRRLEELTHCTDPDQAAMAAVILDVARAKPHRKKRYRYLARHHPELLRRLKAVTGEDREESPDPDPCQEFPDRSDEPVPAAPPSSMDPRTWPTSWPSTRIGSRRMTGKPPSGPRRVGSCGQGDTQDPTSPQGAPTSIGTRARSWGLYWESLPEGEPRKESTDAPGRPHFEPL